MSGAGRLLLAIAVTVCAVAVAEPLDVGYADDGAITIGGERTFVIGTYHAGSVHNPELSKAAAYAELADAGFNVVHASPSDLDLAADSGLMTWVTVGTLDLSNRDESEARLREAVMGVQGHPAVLFLETVDEPAWTWMEATPRVPPEPFREAYPLIKAWDPHHLLYMNHAPANLVTTLQQYNAGTDIVACDIYPVNPGGLKHMYALFEDGHQGDLNNKTISQVGEYVDKMRRVAGPDRPVFMVLQAFAWEMLVDEMERREEKILYPAYAQSRFMAYQAIIRGANGLLYWGSRYTPQPSQAWGDLKKVVGELAELSPVLARRSAPLPLEIMYHEMGHSVDEGVQWLAKEVGDSLYLFTCNADRYPCRATLSGFGDYAQLEVLHEPDREAGPDFANGTVTDTWKRFDVHVYRLSR